MESARELLLSPLGGADPSALRRLGRALRAQARFVAAERADVLAAERADVLAAFACCGCAVDDVDRRGDWSILRLTAGAARYIPTKPIDPKGRDGWALDL